MSGWGFPCEGGGPHAFLEHDDRNAHRHIVVRPPALQVSQQEAEYMALAKELGRLNTELEEKRALKNKILHDADARVLLEGDPSCTDEEEEQAGGGGRALPAKFR